MPGRIAGGEILLNRSPCSQRGRPSLSLSRCSPAPAYISRPVPTRPRSWRSGFLRSSVCSSIRSCQVGGCCYQLRDLQPGVGNIRIPEPLSHDLGSVVLCATLRPSRLDCEQKVVASAAPHLSLCRPGYLYSDDLILESAQQRASNLLSCELKNTGLLGPAHYWLPSFLAPFHACSEHQCQNSIETSIQSIHQGSDLAGQSYQPIRVASSGCRQIDLKSWSLLQKTLNMESGHQLPNRHSETPLANGHSQTPLPNGHSETPNGITKCQVAATTCSFVVGASASIRHSIADADVSPAYPDTGLLSGMLPG